MGNPAHTTHGCVCSVMGKNHIHAIQPGSDVLFKVALEYGLLKDILTIIYYQTRHKKCTFDLH